MLPIFIEPGIKEGCGKGFPTSVEIIEGLWCDVLSWGIYEFSVDLVEGLMFLCMFRATRSRSRVFPRPGVKLVLNGIIPRDNT